MTEEIEIKLTYKDARAVEKKLEEMGIKKEETIELCDRYYSLTGDSMENTNELVRIRKKGEKIELTLKGKCKDENNVWTREEINVSIGDMESMHKILLKSGYKMIKENASVRSFWRTKDVEVTFITYSIPAHLEMIEVECSSNNDIQKILKGLGKLVKVAGEELFSVFDKKKS